MSNDLTNDPKLEKYMLDRKAVQREFFKDPSLLHVSTQLINEIEKAIRIRRRELGLSEWGFQ